MRTAPAQPRRTARTALLVVLLGTVCSGCRLPAPFAVDPGPAIAYQAPPRELRKTSMPDYTVEPPDVLTIDAVNLVPHAPYLLRPLDVISVQATGLPEDLPLPGTGEYSVGVDGTIVLGGGYDVIEDDNGNREYRPLAVAGLPVTAVRDLIQERLAKIARDPEVWVTLLQLAPQQGIAGEHLVAQDGTINLGAYGRVRVVGMTIPEVKAAVEAQLSTRFNRPEVAVDVFGYNSRVYYVVTQGAGLGDQVLQFPITGNETALDAVSQVQGLSATSSTRQLSQANIDKFPGKNNSLG